MNQTINPLFRANMNIRVEDEKYTFTIQELAVTSGPCASCQEAFDTVFKEIRNWALSFAPDVSALGIANADGVPVTFVRDAGTGAGAAVLQRLLDKYGQMTNRQLAEAIGLTGASEVNLSTFSNSLAGKGSRFVRCFIAKSLDQPPSSLWPFLPEKTRQADDDYLSTLSDVGKPY